jgi:hypothetical protein
MLMLQVYLWPLAGVAGGTVAIAALRCLTLFVGFRIALRGAPSGDRLGIFTEFARALSLKSRTEECDVETPMAGLDPHSQSGLGTAGRRRR